MSKLSVWAMLVLGVAALTAPVSGQSQKSKPGLWEISTSVSMPGMPAMGNMGAHTSQVCVTQEMIDKYGGPTSSPGRGNCQMTNVQLTASGMTADMTCSGGMNMTGTVKTTFVDANTTKTTMNMKMGAGGQSMDMTTDVTATYKGPDCGSVKPLPMPASK